MGQTLLAQPDIAYWAVGLSMLTFLGSLILIPWIIVRMPDDYFTESRRQTSTIRQTNLPFYLFIRILKNTLSLVLILAGVAMLVLPGQGLLCILIGISVGDFPGKYRFERWFISRPGILRSINWIRQRARRPPLQMDLGR